MKYSTASIDATNGTDTVNINLDGMTSQSDLARCLWSWYAWKHDQDEDADTDEMPENVALSNPEGFAVHLFAVCRPTDNTVYAVPVANFDDILQAWSDESDDDRREAMGEYLDDMGASDLSDFDEAYQGQYDSGAAFAEQLADDLGAVSEENARWISIDWEATWEHNLRHDYHITDSGHVFRRM